MPKAYILTPVTCLGNARVLGALLLLLACGCGDTLHSAASSGDAEKLHELVDANLGGVDSIDENGSTAMSIAALRGHPDCLRILIEAGGDIGTADKRARSPLHKAAFSGNTECISVLLEAGADIDAVSLQSETPLEVALRMNNHDAAMLLLQSGCDVDPQLNTGYHMMGLAAANGDADIVGVMIERGSPVNTSDRGSGATPLHHAAMHGSAAVVERLLESGASTSAVTARGETPLDVAIRHGNDEAAEVLQRHASPL